MKFKIGKDIECDLSRIKEKHGNDMSYLEPVLDFKEQLKKYKGKDLSNIDKLYKNIIYLMVMGKSETNGIQKIITPKDNFYLRAKKLGVTINKQSNKIAFDTNVLMFAEEDELGRSIKLHFILRKD